MDATHSTDSRRPFPWKQMLMLTALLVSGTYLLTRHANHVFQLLPLLFLFACPLMHLFHHRHHSRRDARKI